MENAKRLDADYIALARKQYGLGDLTDGTCQQYKKKILPLSSNYDEFSQLNAFLEIYLEGKKNRSALQYVESANSALKAGKIKKISIDPIQDCFPFTDPILWGYSAEALNASKSG